MPEYEKSMIDGYDYCITFVIDDWDKKMSPNCIHCGYSYCGCWR